MNTFKRFLWIVGFAFSLQIWIQGTILSNPEFWLRMLLTIPLMFFLGHLASIFWPSAPKKVDPAKVWEEAYRTGVRDEQTSADWTDGQYPAKRKNPYVGGNP